MNKLIALHNALVSVRSSMSHPRMDATNQWKECLDKVLEVTDNDTLAMLRDANNALEMISEMQFDVLDPDQLINVFESENGNADD